MAPEPDILALIPGFLEEVADRLDAIEQDLSALEDGPHHGPRLARLIAGLHTIKGSAACLSLRSLAEAAHRIEAMLEPWRTGQSAPGPDVLVGVRGAIDDLRAMCESLALGAAPDRCPDEIIRRVPLRDLLEHHAALALARASDYKVAVDIQTAANTEIAIDHDVARLLCPILLHTLNNCVDHAAQSSDVRAAVGKSPVTSIEVAADLCADGRLALTICDDGPGLDRSAIASRAAALGCTLSPDPEALDDEAIQRLIFHPGLSTAEYPTLHAGRGVGLEAVRLAISDLGGSVRVLSTPGRGTAVTFLTPVLNHSSGITDTGSESADAA